MTKPVLVISDPLDILDYFKLPSIKCCFENPTEDKDY